MIPLKISFISCEANYPFHWIKGMPTNLFKMNISLSSELRVRALKDNTLENLRYPLSSLEDYSLLSSLRSLFVWLGDLWVTGLNISKVLKIIIAPCFTSNSLALILPTGHFLLEKLLLFGQVFWALSIFYKLFSKTEQFLI